MVRDSEDGFRPGDVTRVNWSQVAAFRLSRHHLSHREPLGALRSVAKDIGGAQAQVLSAAQMSFLPRVRGVLPSVLDDLLWRKKALVRAWCMRRTLYVVPSDLLAVFARGSAHRADREIRWALNRGVPRQDLEKLLDGVLDALERPLTQSALARTVSKSTGFKLRSRPGGGGWGSTRAMPWIEVPKQPLPLNYVLLMAGSRGVICSGPSQKNEATFVRAERWVPGWKDLPVERAERELLLLYLRAFGPANMEDFYAWTGIQMKDVKKIWLQESGRFAKVDVDGWVGFALESDLAELQQAPPGGQAVRLLPYFDSFLLGHRSHRNIVDERNHLEVYRNQGWVSPVLLVNGRAQGVWSYSVKKDGVHLLVEPFGALPRAVRTGIREEAEELGRFLSQPGVEGRTAGG